VIAAHRHVATEGNLRGETSGARAVVCRAVVRERELSPKTVRSRLQVVHSGSERRQKNEYLLISTWVDRALTLPRSSNDGATRPQCASGVAAARRRTIMFMTAAPQTCLPLRLQMEKMSENPRLRRPCSPSWAAKMGVTLYRGRLNMRGIISRQSASWRAISTIADQ